MSVVHSDTVLCGELDSLSEGLFPVLPHLGHGSNVEINSTESDLVKMLDHLDRRIAPPGVSGMKTRRRADKQFFFHFMYLLRLFG